MPLRDDTCVFFERPRPLSALPTPCLLLDRAKAEKNRLRMIRRCEKLMLRPHLKTCRCWEVARRMMQNGDGPCTVATMGEAEIVADHGARDILLAVGIRPGLFARARLLMERGVDLKVVLDSTSMARALVEFAREHACVFKVLLEIDTDGHRAGLAPDSPLLGTVADILREGGQIVAGVLAHAGGSYACGSTECIRAMARREAEGAVLAARCLRALGHEAPLVSVGSTPTALLGTYCEGVTEVRAGVYIYMDLVMAGLGVCSLDDIALSVLTSVIGGFPESSALPVRLYTDAGWSALSADKGLDRLFAEQGYGLVCDVAGRLLPGVHVYDVNQEHGMLRVEDKPGIRVRDFVQGVCPDTRLRVLPNHACSTAMMHSRLYLVEDGAAVAALPLFRGW